MGKRWTQCTNMLILDTMKMRESYTHLFDLMWHDGPLTSVSYNINDGIEQYDLYDWQCIDDGRNVWAVLTISPDTLLDYVEGRISLKKLYEITPWDNITLYFQGGIQKDEYKPVTEYVGYLMKHVTESYFTFDYVLDEDVRKIKDWIRIQKDKR